MGLDPWLGSARGSRDRNLTGRLLSCLANQSSCNPPLICSRSSGLSVFVSQLVSSFASGKVKWSFMLDVNEGLHGEFTSVTECKR